MRALILGGIVMDLRLLLTQASPEPEKVAITIEYDVENRPLSLLVMLASGLQLRVGVDQVTGDEEG